MKKRKMKVLAIFILLAVVSLKVLANEKSDSLYISNMTPIVVRLDTLTELADIQECRRFFERIYQMYPDDWLSLYYVAFCDLKTFYNNPMHAMAMTFLNGAMKNIELLKKYTGADKSEVLTLEGYYFTALIMSNPQSNGKKYFRNVLVAYEKAIKANSQNPRPVCLLAFFEQQLPKMFRSNREPKKQYDLAQGLFTGETKETILPHWGENYLKYIKPD